MMMMEPVLSPEVGSSNSAREIVDDDPFYRGPKFPVKVSELLADAEKFGYEDTVSWLHHGKSFKVHKPAEFIKEIAPTHFCLTKYKSFQRQLGLYGFVRVKYGHDIGAYFHPFFQRDDPSLCQHINRQERGPLSNLKASSASHTRIPTSISGISEPYCVTPTMNPRFADNRTECSMTEFILGPQKDLDLGPHKHLECHHPQNRHLETAIVVDDVTTSGLSTRVVPANLSYTLDTMLSGIAKPNAPDGLPNNIFAARSGENYFYIIEGFPPILQSDLEPTPLKEEGDYWGEEQSHKHGHGHSHEQSGLWQF